MAGYLGVDVVKDGKYYFISYNTEDMDRVSEYVIALAGKGLPIWYDYGIEVGSKWEGTIASKIHGSEAVVIFLSRNIFEKEQSFVHKEFEMARDFYDKKIYVVLLDEIQNKEVPDRYVSWWIDIKHLQCIPAPKYTVEACCEKLMEALDFQPELKKTEDSPYLAEEAAHLKAMKEGRGKNLAAAGFVNLGYAAPEENQEKIPVEKGKGIPLKLLKSRSSGGGEAERIAYEIEKVFKAKKLAVKVGKIKQGAAYYRYYLVLENENPSINRTIKIMKSAGDIELALGRSGVIVAISNEEQAIYVDVPKKHRSVVYLADILESRKFEEAQPGQLLFGVGEDVEGQPVVLDICRMPHLLVAGSAGSGKSVQMHAILLSLMMKYTPQQVKVVLIDPKQTEFTPYEHTPHMLYDHVIREPMEALTILKWLNLEMERRYGIFVNNGVRNIDVYNEKAAKNRTLPKLVILIDEIADLVLFGKKEFEDSVLRIAQKARAAGIHIVLGTQRPTADVITGMLKANIPARMAFKTATAVESRTILDTAGAENLLGNGDLLYTTPGLMKPLRCQAAYFTDEEVEAIVEYVTEYYEN